MFDLLMQALLVDKGDGCTERVNRNWTKVRLENVNHCLNEPEFNLPCKQCTSNLTYSLEICQQIKLPDLAKIYYAGQLKPHASFKFSFQRTT